MQRLRRKRDIEPGLRGAAERATPQSRAATASGKGGNVARARGEGRGRQRTFALAMICSLLVPASPLYTTLITSGSVRCINAIAVQRTRSPPPPALLCAPPSPHPHLSHASDGHAGHCRATHQYGWKKPMNFFFLPCASSTWSPRDASAAACCDAVARRNRWM